MRARLYTEAEVRMLFLRSEGQPSPRSGADGHAGAHVNRGKVRLATEAYVHSRRDPKENTAKSSFLNFADQVRVATDLLNSADGQQKLAELDAQRVGSRRTIAADLTAPVRVHFSMSGSDTRIVPWSRFRMVVDATADSIHLQSCYADLIHF